MEGLCFPFRNPWQYHAPDVGALRRGKRRENASPVPLDLTKGSYKRSIPEGLPGQLALIAVVGGGVELKKFFFGEPFDAARIKSMIAH